MSTDWRWRQVLRQRTGSKHGVNLTVSQQFSFEISVVQEGHLVASIGTVTALMGTMEANVTTSGIERGSKDIVLTLKSTFKKSEKFHWEPQERARTLLPGWNRREIIGFAWFGLPPWAR